MTTANLGLTVPVVGADSDTWGDELNVDLALIDVFAGSLMGAAEVTVASASTCDIGAAACTVVAISGTTAITSFGVGANKVRFVRFTGALTLNHNATSLILLGGANQTTAAGDTAIFKSDATGNWREMAYFSAAYNPASHTGSGAFVHAAGGQVTNLNVNGAPGNAVLSAAAGNSGGAAVEGYFNGASGHAIRFQVDQTTAHLASFYFSTNAVGSITTDNTSTAYNTSSDERLKDEIEDAGEAGLILDSLRVRSWVWKFSGKFEPFGFVAQEEYLIAPFAVTMGDDERPWARDDSKLVPVLVKEIQSLRARMAALEAR